MPQREKKRRSGWAGLAAGALVASVIVVGAGPAAAVRGHPDAASTWRACLGPATESHGFSDVSAGGVHSDDINCLAYYGITTGKTADTFDPQGRVTRSQMALFLARAADVAGVDLGESVDVGFSDIGDADADRRSAINRLVGAGIMFGDTSGSFAPPSTTRFAPAEYVMRWEMAMFLFAFLDHALDSVLVDTLPARSDGDGTGHVELNSADGFAGTSPDDYFGDSRRQTPARVDDRISAIYELGITTGVNRRVGEQGQFDPHGLVTRAQMASFIMRALGHTNLRPAGLTAQSTETETQVSVRGRDFKPVADAWVEMITSSYPDHAFDSDGRCVADGFVTHVAHSFYPCQIDHGDETTDDHGNAVFGVGAGSRDQGDVACSNGIPYTFPAGLRDAALRDLSGDFTVWVWSGALGDIVEADTALFEPVPAKVTRPPATAVNAVVSGGTSRHVKMGRTLTYTVQLVDSNGGPVAPFEEGEHAFTAVVVTTRQRIDAGVHIEDDPGTVENEALDLSTDTARLGFSRPFVPDRFGRFTVTVRNPDPTPSTDDRDVWVQLSLTPVSRSRVPIVDMTTPGGTFDRLPGQTPADASWRSAHVRFSDNEPRAATATLETSPWRLWAPSREATNTIRMVVFDQYGDRFTNRAGSYYVTASASGDDERLPVNSDPSVSDSRYFQLSARGNRTFTYEHRADRPLVQQVGVSGRVAVIEDGTATFPAGSPHDMQPTNATGTVVWAEQGDQTSGTSIRLLIGDARSDSLILAHADNGDAYPAVYDYANDDRFFVEGTPVTKNGFEEILTSPLVDLTGPDRLDAETFTDNATVSWTGYDSPHRHATWRLNGLICRPAPLGGN